MNRFLLALLATLSSTLFGVLFTVSSASAASPWDNAIITTDSLTLRSYPSQSQSQDVSTNYWGIVTANCSNGADLQTEWSNNAVNWAIVLNQQDPPYNDGLTMLWTSNPAHTTNWYNDSPQYSVRVEHEFYWNIYLKDNGDWVCNGGEFEAASYIGMAQRTSGAGNPLLFLSTYPSNYPDDYDGDEIPDTWNPPVFFNPEHTWTVSPDGELRVRYDKNYPGYARGNSYWELRKTDDNPATLLDTQLLTPYETAQYTYTLPGAGYYEVAVGYTGSYPDNWDDYQDWNGWNSSLFSIYWDGFSFASGNNHDRGECDIVCKNYEQEPISNIGGAFGRLNVDMHGLQAIILMPINFIASLPTYVDNCQPINFSFYGSSQQLPCAGPAYASIGGGVIYGIWQTVITAVVVFGVAFDSFRIIKNINSPRNDSIELEKL